MKFENKLNVWGDKCHAPWYRIDRKISFFFRKIKWSYQRIKYGFCGKDLWSLDYTLGNYIAATVSELDKKGMGHPSNLTEKEWHQILNSITTSFYLGVNDEDYFLSSVNSEVRLQEGFHLLQKWFSNLWI